MATETPKRWYEKLHVWVPVASLVIAIGSISIQLKTKSRELRCDLISSTELTSVSEIPGLASSFTYRGTPVTHLWRVSLLFINTGDETLIGEGARSTLIGDGVVMEFTNRVEILNVEPPEDETWLKVQKHSTNSFQLKFVQWLPDEKANVVVYVTSSDNLVQPIMPTPTSRDIVDGKMIIGNAAQLVPSRPAPALEKFPAIVRIPSKAFIFFMALVFASAGILGVPMGLLSQYRRRNWLRRNCGLFTERLVAQGGLTVAERDRFLKDPTRVPKELWQVLEMDPCPRGSFELGDSLTEALTLGGIFVLFGIAGTIYVVSFLVDHFPKLASLFGLD